MDSEKMAAVKEARDWCADELERLRRAPTLNGCEPTPEWTAQERVMLTLISLCDAEKGRQT